MKLVKKGTMSVLIVGLAAIAAGCSDPRTPASEAVAAPTLIVAASTPETDAALIERGEYLARAGDCIACHSTAGKAPYAGGLPIESAVGTIYSTNITPDKTAGIGNYTEMQFANAVRKGVRADGQQLYPAMPYPDYAKTTDEDVHALYVYFSKGVKPSDEAPPLTSLSFPFSMRWGMKAWNWAFADTRPFVPPAGGDSEVARGAYLVQSLAHCGSCHTARGVAMNEKGFSEADAAFLAGGDLEGWHAPDLRGMAKWSKKDIVEYLGAGRNNIASVGGEMTSVVANSTSHLTDEDLNAIAAYLKSIGGSLAPASTPGKAASQAGDPTTVKLTAAKDLSEGQRIYLDNCAACHFVDGRGAPRVFPRIDGASIVNADNPTGLIEVILAGAQTPSTAHAPSVLAMPGFAGRLNDADVAQLATFVRSGWSNKAGSVTESQVAKSRKALGEE